MWRLRLTADDTSIERLAALLPDPAAGVTFTRDADHWLLETPEASAASEAKAALDAANTVLDHLNFAVSLTDPRFVPIQHSSTVVDEHGHATHFATARGTVSVTSSVTAVITTSGPPPTTRRRTIGELVLDLGPHVSELGEVMAVWTRERDPTNLYKVYEIIRDQAGKTGSCAVENLVSKSQTSRFTHTANHPDGAGDRARHARMGTDPPSDPMSEPEMVRFVMELIDRWLHCLAEQLGVPTEAAIPSPSP